MSNEHETKLPEARARMTDVATKLAMAIGRLDAAGVLMGAAIVLLATELGQDRAAAYLRDLAAGVEADKGERPVIN